MVGKTGVGKSEVGNNLLQRKAFESSSCGNSVTSTCQFGSRILEDGYKLVVVDTPGLFDTRKKNTETTGELIRCIMLTSPGPHVFLFVMSVGRSTNEERDTIENLKDIFGKQAMNFVIILFTCKDKLIHEKLTLNQYIEKCPEAVKSIIEECKGRCVAINNYAMGENLEKEVAYLLKVVRETVCSNSGQCYTGGMYQAAEKVHKEKLWKIEEEKRKIERVLYEKERKLEEGIKEKTRKLEVEMERQEKQHKKREMENEIAKQENEREKARNEEMTIDNRMKEKRQEMNQQRRDQERHKKMKKLEEECFILEKIASEKEKKRFELEMKMQMEIKAQKNEAEMDQQKWKRQNEKSKMEMQMEITMLNINAEIDKKREHEEIEMQTKLLTL